MSKPQESIGTDKQNKQEDLIIPDVFTYQFFEANRYSISQNKGYEALCNNGFIKMYTKQCRVYWHAQNQFGHQVHDWKFHISVKHKDLRKAWNLLVALFIKMECRAGMKVIYLKQAQKPQQGRQITLYLIKYDPKFYQSSFAGDFGLSIAVQHSQQYWLAMCKKIQEYLNSYKIESNGLAEGDYRLGKYISFRNEAFIHNSNGESIYPPNSAGWNPLRYQLPIDLKKFQNLEEKKQQESFVSKYKIYVLGGGLILTIGLALIKFRLKSINFVSSSNK